MSCQEAPPPAPAPPGAAPGAAPSAVQTSGVPEVLLENSAVILAGFHSPEIFTAFLETEMPEEDRACLREFSTAVLDEIVRVGGPVLSPEGAPIGVLQQYREAVMGSQMCLFTNSKGGLINGSCSLLQAFFQRYPTVLEVYEVYLMAGGPSGGGGGGEGLQAGAVPAPLSPHLASLRRANGRWRAMYPNDDDYPAHPSESQAPPTANDEEKVNKLLCVNLSRTAPEEEWLPVLQLRDRLVQQLTDFLSRAETDYEYLAGKIQSLVWRLQNEICIMSPSLTPYQVWHTVMLYVQNSVDATRAFIDALDQERRKRYTNTGMWSKIVGAMRARAGSKANAAKSVSDGAFDKVSENHSSQARCLAGLLETAADELSRLRPGTPPESFLSPPPTRECNETQDTATALSG